MEAAASGLETGKGGVERRLRQRELGLPPLRNTGKPRGTFARSDAAHLQQK